VNRQDAHDALLTWCSETGSGTLAAYKAACAHLGLAAWPTAHALSQLGHVEFDDDSGRYAAAPTTLTTVPGLPGRLLLTGARPHGLLEDLATAASAGEADFDVSREPCPQFGAGPSTMYVDGDPADAVEFAADAGIAFCPQAHRLIADRLPVASAAVVAHTPDDRFPHAKVDPYDLRVRWDRPARDHSPGLWLYRTFGGRRTMVLFETDSQPLRTLDGAYGPYLMNRPADADPLIEYRSAHQLLIVLDSAPLPPLHARAACLCSGRLPIRRAVAPDVAHDHYLNVDAHTASTVLESLGAVA
jgi:hypothetical protein